MVGGLVVVRGATCPPEPPEGRDGVGGLVVGGLAVV